MPFEVAFRFDGPLWPALEDAPATINRYLQIGLLRLALQAQQRAQAELYPGHGVRRGRLRRSILGRLIGALVAMVAADDGGGSPVVYAAAINYGWPEGYPGLRGTFEGYHYMDIAQQWVQGVADPGLYLIEPLVEALGGN